MTKQLIKAYKKVAKDLLKSDLSVKHKIDGINVLMDACYAFGEYEALMEAKKIK